MAEMSAPSSLESTLRPGQLAIEAGPGGPGREGRQASAVRVRISDPALVRDLLAYLRASSDCLAIPMSGNMVAVSLSDGLSYDAARLELDFHLADWLLGHENASAAIID